MDIEPIIKGDFHNSLTGETITRDLTSEEILTLSVPEEIE